MENTKRMSQQALDIITSMGITPKLTSGRSNMYVFDYSATKIFICECDERNDIDLFCPIQLDGTVDEQKQMLEQACSMAEEDLKDFEVCHIDDGLAYIAFFIRIKETRHKLYKKHLISILNKMVEGYTTLMTAICIIAYSQSPEFLDSISNEEKNNNL